MEYSVSKPHAASFLHTIKMSSEMTIPTDVLCDIFHLLCDAPIALHDLKNESHFHEFPWAVGQVCRHWRGVFLSYTPLWTSFSLKPSIFSIARFAGMSRRATIYLERSGQRPLTIIASMQCSVIEDFPETVWGVLLSCLNRWKEADLVLEDGAALDELLDRREYMSSLESLRVSIPEILVKNYDAFQVAPHLTKLDLVHGGLAAAWEFPWAQLTKLRIETPGDSFKTYYANSNLWGVLSELENIEELHIIIETFSYPELPSSLAIKRLPSLRLLEITLGFAIMFSWLTAPLLEHLYIRGCNICSAYPPLHNHQHYERQLTFLIQHSPIDTREV